MPSYHYHILQQLPSLIATILLALMFRKIFCKYLNTARKRRCASTVLAINISVVFLLYIVVRNMMLVAELQATLEKGIERLERCTWG